MVTRIMSVRPREVSVIWNAVRPELESRPVVQFGRPAHTAVVDRVQNIDNALRPRGFHVWDNVHDTRNAVPEPIHRVHGHKRYELTHVSSTPSLSPSTRE